MATLISSSSSPSSYLRQIFRDSNGNIVVILNQSDVSASISTDGGDTWSTPTTVTSTQPGDGGEIDTRIDSNDVFHTVIVNNSNNSQTLYNQWTIDTNGSITNNVTDELVMDSANNFDDAQVESPAITLDSTDTIYVVAGVSEKIMGTNYTKYHLLERTGTDSWTGWGQIGFDTGDELNHERASASSSPDDDVNIVFKVGSDAVFSKFTGSGFSVAQETIATNTSASHGGIITDSNDLEVVSFDDNIYDRGGNSWSSERFTDDQVGGASITFGGTDIYIVYQTGGFGAYGTSNDIRYNNATLGNFDTGAETTLTSTSDAEGQPVVRWQFNNANDPSPDIVDIIYFNITDGDTYYESISTATSVSESGSVSSSVTQSSLESALADETSSFISEVTPSSREKFGEIFFGYTSDWDSLVSESNVSHSGDELELSGGDEGSAETSKKQFK